MRDRSRTPCRYPLPVSRQRGFDVSFLQKLRRSMPLHRLELPQVPEWNDRGRLTTQMDHLEGARVTGWGCGHANTVPRSCDIHSPTGTPSTGRSIGSSITGLGRPAATPGEGNFGLTRTAGQMPPILDQPATGR
jgi:hypothetical protein